MISPFLYAYVLRHTWHAGEPRGKQGIELLCICNCCVCLCRSASRLQESYSAQRCHWTRRLTMILSSAATLSEPGSNDKRLIVAGANEVVPQPCSQAQRSGRRKCLVHTVCACAQLPVYVAKAAW